MDMKSFAGSTASPTASWSGRRERFTRPCISSKPSIIQGRWIEAGNGKKRRVYSLTEDGKCVLQAEAKEWSVYSQAVANVLRESYA